LLLAAKTSSPYLWYCALLVTLVFPHALTASATVLTEGPALLFATLGSFLWLESISELSPSPRRFLQGILGGLFMGIAITCRQYYLVLLPAAAVFAYFQWRQDRAAKNPRWSWMVLLSLLAATFLVALLLAIWKGISSPGMATGTSYDHAWKATVGLNCHGR